MCVIRPEDINEDVNFNLKQYLTLLSEWQKEEDNDNVIYILDTVFDLIGECIE